MFKPEDFNVIQKHTGAEPTIIARLANRLLEERGVRVVGSGEQGFEMEFCGTRSKVRSRRIKNRNVMGKLSA